MHALTEVQISIWNFKGGINWGLGEFNKDGSEELLDSFTVSQASLS